MKYKILDDLEVDLKRRVTVSSVKNLDKLGLLNTGNSLTKEEQDLILEALQTLDRGKAAKGIEILMRKPIINEMDIYMNNDKLFLLVCSVFELTESDREKIKEKIEELDLQIVLQGVYDFFFLLRPNTNLLGNYISLLNNFLIKNQQT